MPQLPTTQSFAISCLLCGCSLGDDSNARIWIRSKGALFGPGLYIGGEKATHLSWDGKTVLPTCVYGNIFFTQSRHLVYTAKYA